ncbi:MAG: glucosamine-6-phosphate deaminase [Kiritimatiellae bacterium]|nr:glucosamine-6-phosphate deaminase [Kiritimatiellia bacterium]
MNYQTFPTYAEMSKAAAKIVADVLRAKPDCVLGLATGSSPIGTYDELARMHREEGLSFARCTTVNLDEYRGLAGTHPQSYRYFMNEHLFSRVDVRLDHTFVPNGTAADPAAECAAYDARIKALGGTDIQLLGIGPDGHIGFNEPADEFTDATHVVDLDPSTIEANARFFDSAADVPRQALTMGMFGIMGSGKILLVASGAAKKAVLDAAMNGPVTPRLPASILQKHPDVTVLFAEANA